VIYKVQYGQTIYDIALATYGALEFVYKIIQDNSFIESLDYDFDVNTGAEIVWDETLAKPILPTPVESNVSTTIKTIIATNGQSIFDLCLMTYGDLKYVFKLMQDNDIVSINGDNLSGKIINFNPTLIEDLGFYNYLMNKHKTINTLEPTVSIGKAYNKSFNISFH
jgi:hypothetical protein